ncbi:MAG: hypothetical protein LBL72_08350 [Candidatus Accumulibacter sp.]|nr:hypothetical protein [Accumulibacter sp.]
MRKPNKIGASDDILHRVALECPDLAPDIDPGTVIPKPWELTSMIGLIFDAGEDGNVAPVGIRAVVVGAEKRRVRNKGSVCAGRLWVVRTPIAESRASKHTIGDIRMARIYIRPKTYRGHGPRYFSHLVNLKTPDFPPNIDARTTIPHP